MESYLYLLGPMERMKEIFKNTLRTSGLQTDDEMKPTTIQSKEFGASEDDLLGMWKIIVRLSELQCNAYANLASPTPLETALVNEIKSLEERLRRRLPSKLCRKVEGVLDLKGSKVGTVKYYLATLLKLEADMLTIVEAEVNAQNKRDKKRERIQRDKEKKANVEPESFDKENVVPEKANVEPESFDKENVVPEKTCIPKTALMQYSRGKSTNYSTQIFKGKVTIPVPSDTTYIYPPIDVMYFKLEKPVYEMSGFWWADFSMQCPSEYILSAYGVVETVDDQYFIACESLEQPLATWLKDPKHFGPDKPLSSTLKKNFKDVINGAMHVHNRSDGVLGADLSINNVYIADGRAKLALLSQMSKSTSDFTATFPIMVKREVYETIPIPQELKHLLYFMRKVSWHSTFVTHPVFFSASQMCIYAELAHKRIHAELAHKRIHAELVHKRIHAFLSPKTLRSVIDKTLEAGLVILKRDTRWIAKVKHAVLLDVLIFKHARVGMGNGEDGKKLEESMDKEVDVALEEKVEVGVKVKVKVEVGGEMIEVNYDDTPSGFLDFYRNIVVHIKKGAMTHEEIVFEMNEIIPNFLCSVHEALALCGILVTVGEDFT